MLDLGGAMARIDQYLQTLKEIGADALVMRANENAILRFPSGDKPANQTIAAELLAKLVSEIAPPVAQEKLVVGEAAQFGYQTGGNQFWLSVANGDAGLAVTVERIPLDGEQDQEDAPLALDLATSSAATDVRQPRASAPPSPPPRTAARPTGGGAASSRGGAWIDGLLRKMTEFGGSDLHLSSGCRPYMRVNGDLLELQGTNPSEPAWLRDEILKCAPEDNRQEFEETFDTDFAYDLPGVSRFRFNVFADRKGPGAVVRTIPFEIPSAEDLGIPEDVLQLCELTKGLVLVTGPTGSGKSTTLASLVDRVNATRHDHIITIEDPVEFVHNNKKCLVNQREIRTHTKSFSSALRAALREDPDIVLVGEMRDLETIAIAIETAETGHLVFGTLHTTTAPGTVDRIIDQFPADRQEQIRQMLAKSLRGVVSQVLCRKKGGGRVAAMEILMGNSAVENLIRERKTFQLFSLMQTSRNQGMRTMEESLLELVKQELVEPIEAYRKASNKT